MKIVAVSFDMDGTLIRNTDSVRYLCMINDRLEDFEKIQNLENEESISWVEADYLKVKLIKGLNISEVKNNFAQNISLIRNVSRVIIYLKEKRIKPVLLTSGPIQFAEIIGEKFGFDGIYGSEYKVKDNKFTGKIISHLGDSGKLRCLKDYCKKSGISLKDCVAVGDSESDIAVFKACGKSIAINYTEGMKGMASEYIITEDLFDIVDILKSWLGEKV